MGKLSELIDKRLEILGNPNETKVAVSSGVSKTTYREMKMGKVKEYELMSLARLAKYFRVPFPTVFEAMIQDLIDKHSLYDKDFADNLKQIIERQEISDDDLSKFLSAYSQFRKLIETDTGYVFHIINKARTNLNTLERTFKLIKDNYPKGYKLLEEISAMESENVAPS